MTDAEFKILLNQRLCELAEVFLVHYNPCELTKNSCLLTDDIANNPTVHCCCNCPWKPENKCTFRYVRCKILLCAVAIEKNPECFKALQLVEAIAIMYGLTKRPYLGERYAGWSAELAAMREREAAMKKD